MSASHGQPGVQRFGDWEFTPAQASEDGAVLAATVGSNSSDRDGPPLLVVRSQWSPGSGDTLDVFVTFPESFIAANDAGVVAVEWALRPARIGQANEPWNVAISNDAIFSSQPQQLAKHLLENNESVFSVVLVDDFGDGFGARFSLAGANEAIAQVFRSID